jgi:hypothetical protein
VQLNPQDPVATPIVELRVHWPGPATTPSLGEKLTWFLEYPELELSNNLAENSMHLVAIGRKNWIHIGSQQAGPKVAAILGGKLSAAEACRAQLCGRGHSRIHRSPGPAPPNLRPLPGLASIRSHLPGPSLSAQTLCLFQVPDFRFSIS